RSDQSLFDLRGVPRRENPVDPQRDVNGACVSLDTGPKWRHVDEALGQAQPDPFRFDALEASQPEAARWHQLIEAVRLQKILHLVDWDREPNPCGVRESHANHAEGKPVSID